MNNYEFLIIGGGMTAASAVYGIREIDSDGSIGLISSESNPPYDRPPLSKGLWKGTPLDKIWRKLDNKDVDLHLGVTATEIDPANKHVVCASGDIYHYEKLLLATGGKSRRLPLNDHGVIYYRTFGDYQNLRKLTEKGDHFAVIGGGFIGSEVAAALTMNGKKVTMIFPENNIGSRVFSIGLSQYVTGYYRQKGVEVIGGGAVTYLETRDDQHFLRLSNGTEISVDGVVAGIGIEPNVELARSIGLKIDDGIMVDEFLRTSHPDIYAAGDVAAFINPALGRRMRVEHEDNANTMGKIAGSNMAGRSEPYSHLPSFYSDMFDLGYDAVGMVDTRLDIVADWIHPNEEGAIFYMQEHRVRGVLLWRIGGKVDAARNLIAEGKQYQPDELKGLLTSKEALVQKA